MPRSLSLLTILLTLLAAWAPPASAEPRTPVEFSADGRSWSTQPAGLFDSAVLVPGRTVADTFFVRHRAEGPARLHMSFEERLLEAAGHQLHEWLTLQLRCEPMHTGVSKEDPIVEPGEPVSVDLLVALGHGAPAEARVLHPEIVSAITVVAEPVEPNPSETQEPAQPDAAWGDPARRSTAEHLPGDTDSFPQSVFMNARFLAIGVACLTLSLFALGLALRRPHPGSADTASD